MNDQVRKILRLSFCHREKWIEDNKATTCFKCDKKFNVLYRRKHHCRVCGNIFCNLCSEYSLCGQDMDDQEKEIRTCQACYKKCWKFIQQNDPLYYIKKKGPDEVIRRAVTTIGMVEQSTLSSSGQSTATNMTKRFSKTEEEKLKEIRCLINDFNLESEQPVAEQIKASEKKLSLLVQYVLKSNKIPFAYYDFLFDLSRRIIRQVQPNAMVTHNMDISKHIKIKLEKSLEGISAKYIVGTVLKKGVSSKKMASSFGDCRVMLIYGNIEAKDVVMSKGENVAFQEMIENRKKSMRKVLAKLKEMEVDMIFLEGSIEKEAQDIFFSGGITVIAKVKIQILTRLKLSLEVGRIVEGIGQLSEHTKVTSVGKSRLSYFSKMTKFDDSEEDILVVEGHKAQNGLTLILCGPEQVHLKAIKQELKTILRIGRHLFLKNYKVNLDKQLVQSMSPEIRNTLVTAMTPNIFFSGSAQRHQLTILSYLKNKHLDYKRIVYVESDFNPNNFPDVTRQMIQEYNKNRHRYFRRKWPFFTEICGSNYREESRRFYSEDDWPMGQYILKKLVNVNKKCQTCRKPCYNHTEVYYGRNLYVRIEAETRIIEEQVGNQEIEEADPEYIYEMLARSKTKHKLQCYIECQQCHEQLSSRFVVGQEHLELSLLSFLGNIFTATNYSMREPMVGTDEGSSCQHHKKCRVFQFGTSFLRVYVDFLIIFRPYAVSNTFREDYIRGRDNKAAFDTCFELNSNVEKVVSYLHDQIKKVTETVNNTNFESMVRNPKQSFLKARTSFISARQTVTQSDCVNLFMPELLEQINRINHASQALISAKRIKHFMDARHNATNCIYLLRKMLRLVWEVKKSIQKRELNQKFQNRQDQIDDELMLEEVDINAMANDEQSEVQSQFSEAQTQMQSSIIQDNVSEHNKTQADGEETNWIAMHSNFNDGEQPNRKLRKTESNLTVRKQQKPTDDNIQTIFKTMLTGFKAETAFLSYVSCSPHEPQSLMASALNSYLHKQLIHSGQKIESLKIKMIATDNDFNNDNEELRKINVFLEAQEKMLKLSKEKRTSQHAPQVNILYPTDFQELRQSRNISTETFITTIAGSQQWSTGGGKSGSLFMRSHNELVVIKRINDKEFHTLKRILQTYFMHLKEGSLLTPILGAFEVIRSNRLEYYIVMENLFFGMQHWYIYDFKGSKNRRFSKPPAVPLDLNFLLDRNSEPIFTAENVLKFLPKTLNFLVEHNIIDYSLILVLHVKTTDKEIPDGSEIRIGVVDYLREFGVNQKIQKAWKGSGCTVAEPGLYRDRMQASISRYFSGLPG